jgi:hypothetical protein
MAFKFKIKRKRETPEDRFERVSREFDEMIKKFGWASHYVPLTSTHANYHTHGLQENYGHIDFQCLLPINPQLINSIVAGLADRVKKGEVFVEDKHYDDVISNFSVFFKKFTECGRPVLRLILPDPKGKFPQDADCDPRYKIQYDDIEE